MITKEEVNSIAKKFVGFEFGQAETIASKYGFYFRVYDGPGDEPFDKHRINIRLKEDKIIEVVGVF